MTSSSPQSPDTRAPRSAHDDPGLQPERTVLAWGRTVLALITAAAVCLRWVSHHGTFVLTLFAVAVLTGTAVCLSQRVRYARSSSGITAERVAADVRGVLCLAAAAVVLGCLGLYVVVVLA
ncbi:DUF202 domain-containing protein [Kocuria sp. SM24M-10]|uniref:DUF202 domain-containing protein n=1 Tax=Kocuria sp. SM24M-10 TaxID=1660349 RepID=UPI00064B7579|nr:DUF202 domain-containing protein [Kocuria sp. SM24M-10]KLU10964.1 membrane protein [Kocuria sp. SM24M-10]